MDERKRLEELRGQIAEIDQEILHIIERRARVAQELSKLRPGTSRYAPLAEASDLQSLERAAPTQIPAAAIRPIFTAIDAACRSSEVAPRVVFVGAEGDFGWQAAREHFGHGPEFVRVEATGAALDEVTRSRADFAVVPYESFTEGPIFPTLLAIGGADLKVVGERELSQALVLVSRSGNLAEVEKVYTSPQDHVACVRYLELHHPRALVLDVRSPLMAWDLAAEEANAAAVVPRGFTGSRELKVARENIGDEGEVRIRYGIVSRLPAPRSGHDTTAVLFSVRDRPGALHDILHHFKERNCNLRRIHSRPIPGEGWEYVFYVEVGGHSTDRTLVAALEGVKREAKMLKILGSFPLERLDASPPPERL
ncbi:bifunctional chorismate mutase/prephenate dehydratase [Chondromyces apiculatus]|uniref:Bifunctional chorismate mutase/prephenate dehydratase n=1 Tax=Chondromyces apiculatus DSM 436 TaxID=1192034 RepID=A0A017SYT1_9BACT|nr:prephenate dehydratase domain-containing protein [Chondromyces apiculatus]EYF01780.1 Chorismate mutase I [Chondromyces apiculatus DSM 436]